MYVCIYMYVYIYTYIRTHTHTHTYTHTHTHTHTHTYIHMQRILITKSSAPAPHERAGSGEAEGARTRRVVAGDVLCGGMAGGIATGTSTFFWFSPHNFCFCVVVWRAVFATGTSALLLTLYTYFTTSTLHVLYY